VNSSNLRAAQAHLKDRYRADPTAAVITLTAQASVDDPAGISCSVATGRALVRAGLHPSTGGDGTLVCSGDMLLQALVACAGVTLRAVASSTGIAVRGGTISAQGELDVRGTLGVDKDAPVGFRAVRLQFDLDTDADAAGLATLQKLTERYCVVYQTLRAGTPVATTFSAA
jgi:uncharacterized OsmC-like protein